MRRTGRYGLLLFALGAILLVVPPLTEAGIGLVVTEALFALLLVACAIAVGDSPPLRVAVVGLAALTIGGDALLHVHAPPALWVGVRSLGVASLGLVTGAVLLRIVREERVAVDTILGGICVYLLMGLTFYSVFSILEFLRPGSFVSGGVPVHELAGAQAGSGRRAALLYYSFVTLSTLGYGDVVPTWALPQMLATAEAVVGQLYLAILVASLVGMHLAGRQQGGPPP